MSEKNKKVIVDDWMKDDLKETSLEEEIVPDPPFPISKPQKAYAPNVRPERGDSYEGTTSIVSDLEEEQKENKKLTRSRIRYSFEFYQDQLDDVDLIVRALARKRDIRISKSRLIRLMADEGIKNLKEQLKI